MCNESYATLRRGLPVDERHPEDRAGRRAERPWPDWIGAALGERDPGTERIRRADEGSDVPGIGHLPETENDGAYAGRQVFPPEDADHAWRVPECRHLCEELREHILPGDQQLDRGNTRSLRSLDEVLAFGGEKPGLDPVLAGREKLPDEPELLVLAGLDQAASESEPESASSAAFARSATAANA